MSRLGRSRDHLRHNVPSHRSDDSETDEYNVIGSDRQYERIVGDRASGSSTGTSSRSSNHPNLVSHPVKATHYAESAIYRRSRGECY